MERDILYYIIHDNSMGWCSYVVKVYDQPEIEHKWVVEAHDLDNKITGGFVSNIFKREVHFTNRFYRGAGIITCSYFGWSISEEEFNKLKRIIELRDMVEEYYQILNS
jgi:hypothetical protein